MEKLSARHIVILLLLALLGALLPLFIADASLRHMARVVVLIGAAMSLNLLIGNAGLISMAHGLFMGIGAYIVAVPNVKFGGIGLEWTIPAALLVSVVVGIVCSVIVARARALFFSLLTLALAQVAFVYVARNYALTGGDDGLVGIQVPALLATQHAKYFLSVAVTTGVCLVLLLIVASPFGATLRAIRDNPERVASLGGNPRLYLAAAFIVAGVMGTIMGITAAIIDGSVEPNQISWVAGAMLLVMVALGGRSTFYGPALGVLIIELTRDYALKNDTIFGVQVGHHPDLVVGIVVMLCALAFPEGIMPKIEAFWRSLRSARRSRRKLPYSVATETRK